MGESVLQAAMLEAMLAETIRGMGLDPEKAREELAALAARLAETDPEAAAGATTLRREGLLPPPAGLSYEQVLQLAAKLPNVVPAEGGTYVTIGTVNLDKKHYRVRKAWATVEGVPLWKHPDVHEVRTWRGMSITEAGHEYVPGSEDIYKRYVAVYWVPAGKTVQVSSCWEDAYKGTRNLKTQKYQS